VLAQANILIKDDHRACLADFGLSTITRMKPRDSDSVTTEASRIPINSETSLVPHSPGVTDRWASPELLFPERFGFSDTRPTKQSDCYALGMVIYEVC
jgi:serine/threonine protein kinase